MSPPLGINLGSVTDAGQEPRWLDQDEMRAWRNYVTGAAMLEDRLHRELQTGHGLSLADYELMVRLSEQPGGRMRMSQLAEDVASSKSRVSHQVARMEREGLLARRECQDDGRGVLAELTPKGLEALKTAAPTHVDGVREHIIDLLTPQEQEVLAKVFDRVITHLRSLDG
ncbi:MarR family transcriptional regulator [Umezawaea tangerina]